MLKWRAPFAVIVGACLATLGVTHAQSKKSRPIVLSGTDYAEIQQLSARYSQAIDTCADDGYAYARLYTPDGVFVDMWTQSAIDAGGAKWQGSEKLREISSGLNVTGSPCSSTRFNGSVSHLILNLVITPTPEGATGNSYMIELGGRDPNHIVRMGNYEDVYVKTPDGWRFKTRIHSRAPNGTKPVPPGTAPSQPPR
jgi:SnoaL-like domain